MRWLILLIASTAHAQLFPFPGPGLPSSVAATPTFSPPSGAVSNPTTVTLSSGSCGAYIYWGTTNPPTTGDTNGTSITVTGAATYYAKVIGCPGHTDSAVGTGVYTIATPPSFSACANGSNFGASTSSQATGTINVSSGDAIYCIATYELNCSAATLTIDDTASSQNVLTSVNSAFSSGNGVCSQSFYKANANVKSGDVLTVHASASVPELSIVCATATDTNASSPLDAHPTTVEAVASSVTSGAFTTTSALEIMFAGLATNNNGGTFTPDTGWTMPGTAGAAGACISGDTTSAIQYKAVTSIQTGITTTVGFSAARVFQVQPVTFK